MTLVALCLWMQQVSIYQTFKGQKFSNKLVFCVQLFCWRLNVNGPLDCKSLHFQIRKYLFTDFLGSANGQSFCPHLPLQQVHRPFVPDELM